MAITLDGTNGIGVGATPELPIDVEGQIRASDGSCQVRMLPVDASNAAIVGTFSNDALVMYTNSSERMRVDEAGRVTMPYQPYFYAKAGAQRNSVSGVLTYSNTVHNIGNHYNGTNRFTAPVAGVYFFKAQAYKEGTSAGTLRLRVNGVNVEEDGRQIGGTTTHSSVITVSAYKLNAGDYVEILTDYPSHQNADYSVFTGFLLG